MLNMSVRVSQEELDVHGQKSIALPNGGYLAWLGVFHELHCVVRIFTRAVLFELSRISDGKIEIAAPVELQGVLLPEHDGA